VRKGITYVIKTGTVDSRLDDLNGGIIADLDARIDGQRDLGQTEGAGVGACAGAVHLEDGDHGVGHVDGDGAEAEVDVEEGGQVAGVPARLDGDGAAGYGPEGAVRGGRHAAAWTRTVSSSARGLWGRCLWGLRGRVGVDLHGYIHCMPYG